MDKVRQDRLQHADVHEANFHPIVSSNDRILRNADQNGIAKIANSIRNLTLKQQTLTS